MAVLFIDITKTPPKQEQDYLDLQGHIRPQTSHEEAGIKVTTMEKEGKV